MQRIDYPSGGADRHTYVTSRSPANDPAITAANPIAGDTAIVVNVPDPDYGQMAMLFWTDPPGPKIATRAALGLGVGTDPAADVPFQPDVGLIWLGTTGGSMSGGNFNEVPNFVPWRREIFAGVMGVGRNLLAPSNYGAWAPFPPGTQPGRALWTDHGINVNPFILPDGTPVNFLSVATGAAPSSIGYYLTPQSFDPTSAFDHFDWQHTFSNPPGVLTPQSMETWTETNGGINYGHVMHWDGSQWTQGPAALLLSPLGAERLAAQVAAVKAEGVHNGDVFDFDGTAWVKRGNTNQRIVIPPPPEVPKVRFGQAGAGAPFAAVTLPATFTPTKMTAATWNPGDPNPSPAADEVIIRLNAAREWVGLDYGSSYATALDGRAAGGFMVGMSDPTWGNLWASLDPATSADGHWHFSTGQRTGRFPGAISPAVAVTFTAAPGAHGPANPAPKGPNDLYLDATAAATAGAKCIYKADTAGTTWEAAPSLPLAVGDQFVDMVKNDVYLGA